MSGNLTTPQLSQLIASEPENRTRSVRALHAIRSRFTRCALPQKYEMIIAEIIVRLYEFCTLHKLSADHGFVHAIRVYEHARYAYGSMRSVSIRNKFQGLIAALLHDVDDHKLFPESVDYANTREIISDRSQEDKKRIIRMIGLVSFSANGNRSDGAQAWELVARYADRCEAIGDEGVERCLDYTLKKGRPLFTLNTPRFMSIDQMLTETHSRMRAYTGASESFVDHFYDKLGHLLRMTDNDYINEVSLSRMEATYEIILEFGKKGFVTEEEVRSRIQ